MYAFCLSAKPYKINGDWKVWRYPHPLHYTVHQVRQACPSKEYVCTGSGGHALSEWFWHTPDLGWSGRQVYAQRGTSGRDRVVLGDAPKPVNPTFHPWSISHPCDACTDNNSTVQLYASTTRGSTRPQEGTLALLTPYGVPAYYIVPLC